MNIFMTGLQNHVLNMVRQFCYTCNSLNRLIYYEEETLAMFDNYKALSDVNNTEKESYFSLWAKKIHLVAVNIPR